MLLKVSLKYLSILFNQNFLLNIGDNKKFYFIVISCINCRKIDKYNKCEKNTTNVDYDGYFLQSCIRLTASYLFTCLHIAFFYHKIKANTVCSY